MRTFLVMASALLFAADASAQQCVNQARRSIEQAVRVAASSDVARAQRLLEQAERECPNSFVVYRELSKTYLLLGDNGRAASYAAMANRLDPRAALGDTSAPAVVSAATDVVDGKSFVGDKWALVVGVGDFRSQAIPHLEYAAKDASDVAQLLTDPTVGRFRNDQRHVRLLTNEQATLANVRAEINNISKYAREEDMVVLYLSSHGTSAKDDRAAKAGAQTGYIVLHDTDTENLYGTAFAMDELKRVVVDRLRARRVVTFLDTCFSGDAVKWAGDGSKALTVIPTNTFSGVAQGTGRVVIVSSQGTELSWEGDGNSYFTKGLKDALRLKGGLPTISDVFNHLRAAVPSMVQREKRAAQNPAMWPEGRYVDIVIGTPVQ